MLDHIKICDGEPEGIVFPLGALVDSFSQVHDHRHARGKRYSLPFLLAVIALAKLSGQHQPTGIAEWGKHRCGPIARALGHDRGTAPSLNTLRRTLAATVSADALLGVLNRFLHEQYGGQQSVQVVIDGKTLRGTIPSGQSQGVHLLAAYLPSEGIVLVQVAVESKENEKTKAPQVLKCLDLRGRVVTGDAMFTQRDLSVEILALGGDYIWYTKDNQPHLKEDVELFFVPPSQSPGWHKPPLPQSTAQQTNKVHGRLERRVLTVMSDNDGFLDWPGVRQVFKLERFVTHLATGETTAYVIHGITSLSAERADAEDLLEITRNHWRIENSLHYRRDKTMLEDATRMTNYRQAQVMAVLNCFIIALVTKLGFTNLASAQRTLEAKFTLALAHC